MGEEGAACATMGAVTGGGEVSPLGSSCFDESSLAGSVGTANSLSSPYRSIFPRQRQEECKMKVGLTAIEVGIEVGHVESKGRMVVVKEEERQACPAVDVAK